MLVTVAAPALGWWLSLHVGRGSELGFHLLALFMLGEVKKASGERLEG